MINPFLYNVPSLDVHGCDRTIAVALLKEFIDLYSSRTAHKKLILVHGKGMGILKKATYEYLKHDKRVLSFMVDFYNDGQTIIVLK